MKKFIHCLFIPIIGTTAIMPLALSSCSTSSSESETEEGDGNITIQKTQKTQTLEAGSSSGSISVTLNNAIQSNQKLNVSIISSNENATVSAKVASFTIDGLNVKTVVELTTDSEYGLQDGDSASFSIKYTLNDTSTSTTVWESKVQNCKLTYKSPITPSLLNLVTNEEETLVSTSVTVSSNVSGTISILSQTSDKAKVTLNKDTFSQTSNAFSLTMSSKTSSDLAGGESVNFVLKFTTSSWTQIIPNYTATYVAEDPMYIPKSNLNISGTTLSGITGTIPSTCTTLKVPSTITKISNSAFQNAFVSGSKITTIIIPPTVTEIESYAFSGCSAITKLDMSSWASTPTWSGINIFQNWASTGTLSASSTSTKILICDYIFDKLPGLWTANDYMETYIKDRTFTIGCLSNTAGSACIGTGWIVSDATPSNPNDYTYYIATNWHVTHGMAGVAAKGNPSYLYADYSLADSSTGIVDIYDYWKMNYTTPVDNDFIYSNYTQSTYRKDCIDFQITKMQLGSKSSATGTPTGSIKTKLDKLNKKNSRDGYITDFTDIGADISAKSTWIGGYPGKEESTLWGGKWETHKMSSNNYDYTDIEQTTTESVLGNEEVGHSISYPDRDQTGADQSEIYERYGYETEPYYYYDISPQYTFKSTVALDWMDGGSSGSMLVTQDYKICALYWGGWGSTRLTPAFSIFRSNYKDFVSKYWSK